VPLLPFSPAQFFDVFRQYNQSVWPAQWLLNALAVLAIILAARGSPRSSRWVSLILAALWMWTGIAYHLVFFRKINAAAVVFGAAFVTEAALMLWLGVVKGDLRFRPHRDTDGVAGTLFMAYALLVYPAIGWLLGRRYPDNPTFGLPCPTTIFTFGLLLWSEARAPLRIVVIPALWALIGFSAARSLSVTEDYGLLVAGLVGTSLLALRKRRADVRDPHDRLAAAG